MRIFTVQAHGKNGDFEGNMSRLLQVLSEEQLASDDLIVTSQGALFGFDMKSYNGNHPVMFAAFEHMLERLSTHLPCPLLVPLIYNTSFSMLEEPVVFYVDPQRGVTYDLFDPTQVNTLIFDQLSIFACASDLLYACGEITTELLQVAQAGQGDIDTDNIFISCLNAHYCSDDDHEETASEEQERTLLDDHQETSRSFFLCFTADPYEYQGEGTHTGISVSLFSYSQDIASYLEMPVVISGEVGGYDKRVYIGGSFITSAQAQLIASAPCAFEEAAYLTDFDNPNLSEHAQSVIQEMGHYCLFDIEKPATNHQVLRWFAMRRGIKDYVRDAGYRQVILGLSGGLDSAVVAELAAQALGPQAVTGVIMPSAHTSAQSLADAHEVVERLGIKTLTIPINDLVGSVKAFFGLDTAQPGDLLAYQNLQSRLRGVILMTLSNHTRSLVLSTTNKSEALLGYSTLYGDTVGAYAPLVDVYKSHLVEMLESFERDGLSISKLPTHLRVKAPTAELSDNQTDEADLGVDYATLDHHLEALLGLRHAQSDLGARYDRALLAELATRVLTNEYKRRQEPLGPLFTWPDPERPVMHPIMSKINAEHFVEALAALPSYAEQVEMHLEMLKNSLPEDVLGDLRSYLLTQHVNDEAAESKAITYVPTFVFDEASQEKIVHYAPSTTFDHVDLSYRKKGLRRMRDTQGAPEQQDETIKHEDTSAVHIGQDAHQAAGMPAKPSPWPEENHPSVREIDPSNQEMLEELTNAVRQAMKARRRSPGSFDASLFDRN